MKKVSVTCWSNGIATNMIPVRPPVTNMKMKPAMKRSGVLKCAVPVTNDMHQAKTWIVLGITTIAVPAAKKIIEIVLIPVVYMWCAQTPKPTKTTSSSATATSGNATTLRCVNAGMIEVAIPNAGTIRMYTSGCPKIQKRCCQRRVDPPWLGSKKCVPTLRSRKRKIVSADSAGNANSSPKEAARKAKQKSGIRLNDIPGARDLKIVTMNCAAVSVDEIELKMIPSA